MMHRKQFRKKAPVKWHSSLLTYAPATPVSLTHLAAQYFELVNTSQRAATQAGTVLPDNAERFKLLNIRGSIWLENDSSTNFHEISWGVFVGDLVSNANVSFPLPWAQVDSQRSWLWLEHTVLAPALATRAGLSLVKCDVDIRTKRVLRPDQSIVLVIYDTPVSGVSDECFAYLGLRSLISRVD